MGKKLTHLEFGPRDEQGNTLVFVTGQESHSLFPVLHLQPIDLKDRRGGVDSASMSSCGTIASCCRPASVTRLQPQQRERPCSVEGMLMLVQALAREGTLWVSKESVKYKP